MSQKRWESASEWAKRGPHPTPAHRNSSTCSSTSLVHLMCYSPFVLCAFVFSSQLNNKSLKDRGQVFYFFLSPSLLKTVWTHRAGHVCLVMVGRGRNQGWSKETTPLLTRTSHRWKTELCIFALYGMSCPRWNCKIHGECNRAIYQEKTV